MRASAIIAVIVASAAVAAAQGLEAANDKFPVQGGTYVSDNGAYYGTFATEMVSLSLTCPNPPSTVSPLTVGPGYEIDSFFDVFFDITYDGGGMYHIDSFFDVFTELSIDGGASYGTFATEIVAMSLSGAVGGHAIEFRESPSLRSVGEHTVTDIGGGLYHIDSFFDVFTELSVDGGPFVPASGAIHMSLVPEPATLSLLGLGGLALIRRRR